MCVALNSLGVIIIIPARNEAKTIAEMIERSKMFGSLVLVVDDASTDGTGDIATKAGAKVLKMKYQQGNFKAIKAGFKYALNYKNFNWLITLDADGQHAPEDIPDMLKTAELEKGVIIGSCPERSSWMRRLVWSFFRFLSGLQVHDMTSGFKVYTRQAAACICGNQTDNLIFQDVPTLLFLTRKNISIKEIPVKMLPRRLETGISRVFSSWRKVAIYMLHVTCMCLSHRSYMARINFINYFKNYLFKTEKTSQDSSKEISVSVTSSIHPDKL